MTINIPLWVVISYLLLLLINFIYSGMQFVKEEKHRGDIEILMSNSRCVLRQIKDEVFPIFRGNEGTTAICNHKFNKIIDQHKKDTIKLINELDEVLLKHKNFTEEEDKTIRELMDKISHYEAKFIG